MRLCAVMNIFGIVPPNTKSGASKNVLICDNKLQDPIGVCLVGFFVCLFVCFLVKCEDIVPVMSLL